MIEGLRWHTNECELPTTGGQVRDMSKILSEDRVG